MKYSQGGMFERMYVVNMFFIFFFKKKNKNQLHKRWRQPSWGKKNILNSWSFWGRTWSKRDNNGSKVQFNNRQHFRRIKTKEAALLGRESLFNLGCGTVYQEAGTDLISVSPGVRNTIQGKSAVLTELSFLVCKLEVEKYTVKQDSHEVPGWHWALNMIPPSSLLLTPSYSSRPGRYYRRGSRRGRRWLRRGLGQQAREWVVPPPPLRAHEAESDLCSPISHPAQPLESQNECSCFSSWV